MNEERSKGLGLWVNRLLMRSDLQDSDLRQLAELNGRTEKVLAGRDVVPLGRKTHEVTLVLAGTVAQYGQTRDGNRQIVSLHLPGEMADLQSAVVPHACCAHVALVPSSVLRIQQSSIQELLRSSPRLAAALWRDTSVDASIVAQRLVIVARGEAMARIAHLFCELGIRTEVLGGCRTAFDLPFTQSHLGEMIGLTGVHVNRTLRAMKDAGLLEWTGRRMLIKDWDQLARRGEFHPIYLHLQHELEPV